MERRIRRKGKEVTKFFKLFLNQRGKTTVKKILIALTLIIATQCSLAKGPPYYTSEEYFEAEKERRMEKRIEELERQNSGSYL